MQMDRARYERKAAWDYASHEGPRMDSWHAHFKPNGSPIRNHHPKPKSRLAAQCYKPALLRIKLDKAH